MICESTAVLTMLDGRCCRLWKGVLAEGRPVDVYVACVASADPYTQEALARELAEQAPPIEVALADLEKDRLREQLARLAPVVDAARRATARRDMIRVDEWDALCRAVAWLEEWEKGTGHAY